MSGEDLFRELSRFSPQERELLQVRVLIHGREHTTRIAMAAYSNSPDFRTFNVVAEGD